MKLTLAQAEAILNSHSVKTSDWHENVGIRFRIYQVQSNFKINQLPDEFKVLFTNSDGDRVIREWIDTF